MVSTITPKTKARLRKLCLGMSALASLSAWAMDTDIFTSNSSSGAPNVLIVIDNTSNWSRNDEKFPDGNGGTITQGQAEINAIKTVIQALPGNINIGLMEFVTDGNANDTGGFIRQAISPMGLGQGTTAATNKANFSTKLDTIYGDINGPHEKINSGTPYGDLMYDAYNYFIGGTPVALSADVNATRADAAGYTTSYTKFKAPISAADICAANHIIFIGNPPANGPTNDSSANKTALTTVGGAFTQLALPPYSQTTTAVGTSLGYSNLCLTTPPTSSTVPTDYTSQCPSASSTYDSCGYSGNDTDSTTTMNACPTGQLRYTVIATTPSVTTTGNPVVTTTTNTGTSACYSSAAAASGDQGGLTCPANTSTTSGNTTTTTTYSCSYVVGTTPTSSCASTVTGPTAGAATTSTATTSHCYTGTSTGNDKWTNASPADHAGLTCPANTSTTSGSTTTATTYSCIYSGLDGSSTGCAAHTNKVNVTQTSTPSVTTTTTNSKYGVTQTVTKTVTTGTTTGSTQTTLGNTSLCYNSLPSGTPTDYTCPFGATCSYSSTGATSTGICPAGKAYKVFGYLSTIVTAPTGGVGVTDTATYNADEWARFMNTQGFSVTGTTTKAHVRTHAIDVYGVKPNAVQSSLLSNMGHYGGGGYYTATNPGQIVAALKTIFGEISATNSTFASAALPISATQRSQNDNQVYIGMFRPDQQSLPRWMGNVKRYQLGLGAAGATALVDALNNPAVSTSSGFITPCAQSWWSSDSGNYWATVDAGSVVTPRIFFTTQISPGLTWSTQGDDTVLAAGECLGKPAYSDLPDGAVVEKGGVAEMMRNATSRTVKTLSGSTLVDFNATNVTFLSGNATINQNIIDFILGKDITGELNGVASTSNRPSIHGGVIHSRPQPVDYGGTTGVKVFYGSNDGTFRVADAATGKEDWAFVPTESYPYLQRLLDNSPAVQTPSPTPPGQTAAPGTPKEFFFDGSTGLYQSGIGSGSKTWIYPAMRRGGRMLYAFDVSAPASPTFVNFRR